MTITVEKIRIASKSEWDRIWSECEFATFFHSREWSEIWQNYTNGNFRPFPFSLVFSDGTRAVFPLTWNNAEQMYFSSPAWTYGGLISLDSIDTRHLLAVADWAPKVIGRVFIRTNPFLGIIDPDVTALPFHDDETHVLYLKEGIESVFKGWTKGHKSAVIKARREGVTISQASSPEEWREYFGIYKDSLERWGDKASSRYDWTFFESISNRKSANIKLWLAYYNGKAIAGALCFYSRNHAVYWHGAALRDYFKLRSVQLLLFEAIRRAVENGFSWFDLNPSGGHEGVKLFKRGFGTSVLSCPWLEVGGNDQPGRWRNKLSRTRMRIMACCKKYLYERTL
jgi:hypothetical protein